MPWKVEGDRVDFDTIQINPPGSGERVVGVLIFEDPLSGFDARKPTTDERLAGLIGLAPNQAEIAARTAELIAAADAWRQTLAEGLLNGPVRPDGYGFVDVPPADSEAPSSPPLRDTLPPRQQPNPEVSP